MGSYVIIALILLVIIILIRNIRVVQQPMSSSVWGRIRPPGTWVFT